MHIINTNIELNGIVCCRAIDFGELLSAEVRARHAHTSYDLIANIVHDGEPGAGKGTYRVHILHKVLTTSVVCVSVCHA